MGRIKTKLYKLLEKGDHGKRKYAYFDYFIQALIILSVVAIIMESMEDFHTKYRHFFYYFELTTIGIFSIEYILRIYISDLTHPSSSRIKSAFKFMFSLYGLIDLLAILPYYLPLLFTIDMRFIRILRLFRLFRLFKFNRYNRALRLIADVIKERKVEFGMTTMATFLVLVIASILMYYVEGQAQPDKFPSIPAAFWWAVITLTTVGYGDVYPVTSMGRFLSGFIALLGIGLVALPTGIISAGFLEKFEQQRQKKPEAKVNTSNKCPHCGKPIDKA